MLTMSLFFVMLLVSTLTKTLDWWGDRWGSNPRQPESQSGTLPTELRPPPKLLAVRKEAPARQGANYGRWQQKKQAHPGLLPTRDYPPTLDQRRACEGWMEGAPGDAKEQVGGSGMLPTQPSPGRNNDRCLLPAASRLRIWPAMLPPDLATRQMTMMAHAAQTPGRMPSLPDPYIPSGATTACWPCPTARPRPERSTIAS